MESATAKAGSTPSQGWHLVRIAVAGLLLTASALKCWQLATEPIIGTSLLDSRWLLMATVEFELLFGLWLLANIWAKPTWAAALACFGLFTCVSVCKAISGHASCGCFGRVPVNPWYTGAMDLAAVCSLLRWRPNESFFTIRRATAVLVIWLAVGIPAAFAMGSYKPTTLSDAGTIIGNDEIVMLEPEKWIGKRFPLLDYIDIGNRLKEGKWLVLLYRYDCPQCQEAIQNLLQAARKLGVQQVALIEIAGSEKYAGVPGSPTMTVARGQLSNATEWFAESPLWVLLSNGTVRRASGLLDKGIQKPASEYARKEAT